MSTVADLSVADVGRGIRITDRDLMLEGTLFSMDVSVARIADRRLADEIPGDVPGYKTVTLKIGRATAQVRQSAQIEVLS